ncbi:hypothetical protein INR49_014460 [Caranx melampygus]|nr:hypothetical protein INR49_014460 [Caranx melampygus]
MLVKNKHNVFVNYRIHSVFVLFCFWLKWSSIDALCLIQTEELAGDPVVSGSLCGGRARVALASRQYGVKVEINVSVHEVAVDNVVNVTIQVFCEHVYVQVRGQSVLTGGEAGRRSELTHHLQTRAGIGRGDRPPVMRAHGRHRTMLGLESGELRQVLRHT